jgi:hypothetical protein
MLVCGTLCINPNTNADFCGAGANDDTCAEEPGEDCGAGICSNGNCCPTGQVSCGGTCIDPLAEEDFCGASGDCVDDANDATNGSNGADCSTGTCSSGHCCPTGQIWCGTNPGACIDPQTNDQYCGADTDCTGTGDVGDDCLSRTPDWNCDGGVCEAP